MTPEPTQGHSPRKEGLPSEDRLNLQEVDKSPVEGWELLRLGQVLSMEYGNNLPTDDREEGDIPVYGSNGQVDTHSEPEVHKPGLILGRKGSIGEIELSEGPFWPIDTTYYITEEETDENLRFLQYLLKGLQLERLNAASAIPGLNRNDAYGLKALIPPRAEQRKIASVLYNLDQKIQKSERIQSQLEKVRVGIIRELLQQGIQDDELRTVRMGPKDIRIPSSWDMKECGDLFRLENGRAFSKDEWTDDGTQIIRIQDLREEADADEKFTDIEVEDQYHVAPGDLLFCWAGNIKTSLGAYIWDSGPSYLNQHIYNMRPKKELNRNFFRLSLNRYLRILKTMVSGSAGQIHVTKGDLQSFKIPTPPPQIQDRVAEIVESIGARREQEKEYLQQLRELRNGLMQDLLSGEVRTHDKPIDVLPEVKQHG